ncbi:MAG: hypothetical protein A2X49_04355 [Lentisphaerae bacterium GWF2_52_8]|nr:MAG: hypothetical protein A2X49_04355 [Lentisphaerae bacterium GWF2_52_8]
MKKLFSAFLFGCFFLSVSSFAGLPEAIPVEGTESGIFTEANTGMAFPEKMGALERKHVLKYKQEEYGVNINFSSSGVARADVYIYGLPDYQVPGGARSIEAREQFEGTVNAIFILEKKGVYKDATLLFKKEFFIKTSGFPLPALWAKLEYSEKDAVELSHVLLTGYHGKFLKIRFTYKKDEEEKGDKAFFSFMTALGKIMDFSVSKQEFLAAYAVFSEKPFSPQGVSSLSNILYFAANSKEVEVIFNQKIVPWLPKGSAYKFSEILAGSYVAGNVKEQLEKGLCQNDSYAGLLQVLKTYEQSKEFDKSSSVVPEIEELAKLEKEGKLKAFVAEILKKTEPVKQNPKGAPAKTMGGE